MSNMAQELIARLSTASERVTVWLARGGAVGLALMMLLTFSDVVGRAFNHPIVGAVEVTELLMGLIIFLGIGLTTFLRAHIRVDIVITYLSPRVQAIIDTLTMAISSFFAVLICWQLWLKAADTVAEGDVTQIWALPVWPVAYVMAACSITLVTGLVLHFLRSLHLVIKGDGVS